MSGSGLLHVDLQLVQSCSLADSCWFRESERTRSFRVSFRNFPRVLHGHRRGVRLMSRKATGHCRALPGTTGHYRALPGTTGQSYRALPGTTGHYRALPGTAGHGRARPGRAGHYSTVRFLLVFFRASCIRPKFPKPSGQLEKQRKKPGICVLVFAP